MIEVVFFSVSKLTCARLLTSIRAALGDHVTVDAFHVEHFRFDAILVRVGDAEGEVMVFCFKFPPIRSAVAVECNMCQILFS